MCGAGLEKGRLNVIGYFGWQWIRDGDRSNLLGRVEMSATISLEPFDKLIEQLQRHGIASAAESIAILRRSGWTSSSELIGELALAVLQTAVAA
ncbi:MAG: hypothetical protein JWN13_1562 [Betaproteobacteria bacterium]|nr:hypothetical protein [Betaproteobacteria bacterium]